MRNRTNRSQTKTALSSLLSSPFSPPSVSSFLLLNSVALHGDGCPICQSVETELIRLSGELNCSLQVRDPAVGPERRVRRHLQQLDLRTRSLCPQTSEGGSEEGCEGPRLHSPSSPVMLQVKRTETQRGEEELVLQDTKQYGR